MYQTDATASLDDLLRMQRQQMQVCGCEGAVPGGTVGAVAQATAVAGMPRDQQFASSVEVSAAVCED